MQRNYDLQAVTNQQAAIRKYTMKERIRIELPPIRDDSKGYDYLTRLTQAVISRPEPRYIFDFSKCSTISHNGLAVLGGIADFLRQYEAKKRILWRIPAFELEKVSLSLDSMSSYLRERIRNFGFFNYVNPDHGITFNEDYIGYREHRAVLEDAQIINHLQDSWLTHEKLNASKPLKSAIVSSIYEIFVNAYGHGLKENAENKSVISCGHYEKKEKKLSLSVFDLGGGIVDSVQRYTDITDSERAFEWALEAGNSTRTDSPPDMPRGLGFGILREFISVNKGSIRICSDSYIATVNASGDYEVNSIGGHIPGTLVSLTINCDDLHYRFASENTDAPKYF